MIELLWRRGHIDPNDAYVPNETEAIRVAKEITDLKNEPSEIELTLNSLDVDVIFTPKEYCEIVGRGAERVWG